MHSGRFMPVTFLTFLLFLLIFYLKMLTFSTEICSFQSACCFIFSFGNIGMFLELEYKSKKCILGKMHFCNIPHIFSLKIFQSIKNCFTMDFPWCLLINKSSKKNKTLCIFYLFCFCYHCNIPHR